MDEEELKFLSKHKHIYYIYSSPDHKIHIVKYAVIYLNKFYVYFKVPGNSQLVYRSLEYVHDEITSDMKTHIQERIGRDKIIDEYYWTLTDESLEFLSHCFDNYEELVNQNEAFKLLSRIKYYELEIESLEKKLEKLNVNRTED